MLNTFNADEPIFRAPELTVNGTAYHGRAISAVEWFRYKKQLDALPQPKDAATEEDFAERIDAHAALFAKYLRDVFPAKDGDDPIAALETLGFTATSTAFGRFFSHQMHALGLVPVHLQNPSANPTDGTSSPDRTTNGPSASDNASPTS